MVSLSDSILHSTPVCSMYLMHRQESYLYCTSSWRRD